MPIEFTWDESYSVGNEELDEQHKRMFHLANSLPEDLEPPRIEQIIVDLYRHAREHFSLEEKMMREIGYPKIQEHQDLHNALLTKLNDMSLQSFKNDQSVFAFKKFIYDWVIDHIMNQDKDYFRFAKNVDALAPFI